MKCTECRKRKATHMRYGTSAMDFVHGAAPSVCLQCGLEEAIREIEREAAKLPELREQLAGLKEQEMIDPHGGYLNDY